MALHRLGLPHEPEEKNTVGSLDHLRSTSPSGCASFTIPWWCKSHQRWRPVCLRGPRKWQRTVHPLLAPTTTALLSTAKLSNNEATVPEDPSHRLTEYTSSFSLLNQSILHHSAMRRIRVSAGDGGVGFCSLNCQIRTHTAMARKQKKNHQGDLPTKLQSEALWLDQRIRGSVHRCTRCSFRFWQ